MTAKYNNIEVNGESKEHCLELIAEAVGSFDASKNEIIKGSVNEGLVVFSYTKEEQKLHTDYNGTDVSLTSKDAVGLLQVKAAFEFGVTKTKFLFANGTVMDMTPAVFAEFAPWFAVKRNELFTS